MVNESQSFTRLLKDNMRLTLGPDKDVKIVALFDNRMNDSLDGSCTIKQKIKFECPTCKKEWSSACGVTQWFYKLQILKDRRGSVLGCTLFFKVHAYTQKCLRCHVSGKIEPYDDEYERLSKVMCNTLAKKMCVPEKFPKPGDQRKSNMRKPHQKSLCGACAAGVCSMGRRRR